MAKMILMSNKNVFIWINYFNVYFFFDGSGSPGLLPAPGPLRTCMRLSPHTAQTFQRPFLLGSPGCSYQTSDDAHLLSGENVLPCSEIWTPDWIIGIRFSSDLAVSDDGNAMRVEQLVYMLITLYLYSDGEYPLLVPVQPVFALCPVTSPHSFPQQPV